MNRKEKYKDLDRWRRTCNEQNKRYYAKTALYKPRPWTERENKLVLEHRISDTNLSSKIHRSVRAIQIHRSKLKKYTKSK